MEAADILNVTVTLDETGFAVTHLDEERYRNIAGPPYYMRDEYILTPNDVSMLSSLPVAE